MKLKCRVGMLMAALALAGCSGNAADAPSGAHSDISNVKLSAEQRQHVQIFTVASSQYHKTIEANGAVDFDNDQATSVLAPFSGPVSRLLVSLGDRVKKGSPLAAVDSSDFAAAIGAYHKAIATAQTNRRLADLDKDLLQHNGVAQREAAQAETDAANAEADRDAALQGLVSLSVPAETIKEIQDGHPVSHAEGFIRSPINGTVVEKLVTPGELLQAGSTACFTVANLSRMWVMAQIFGADLSAVGVGGYRRGEHRHRFEDPARQGRQHCRAGGSGYPLCGGARGGGQSRRNSKEADVRAGAHQGAPGNRWSAGAGLGDSAR